MRKVIINATTYDFETLKKNQYILFDNTIIETGDMKDMTYDDLETIDASGAIVMPGLVNGHAHIYSTFSRGLGVPYNPANFLEILEQMWWRLDYHINNEVSYYSALVSGVEFLKNGITTVIDHHASGTDILGSLAALRKGLTDEAKVRSVLCFETSDRFNIEESIKENIDYYNNNQTDVARGLFGLHAAFTLSDETLKKIGERNDAPIHVHVDESQYDTEYCMKHYGKTPIKRFDQFGLIKENSLLAHCLFVEGEDLDIIKARKAKVVFNTTSNMNNGVGLPNYHKFNDKGIDVIIGNDGISSSIAYEYLNIFFTQHLNDLDVRKFGFGDLLKMIDNTYDYASELLGVKLGKIKAGYEADLSILKYTPFTEINNDNALGHLLFGLFHNFKPETVFIKGEEVLSNYKVSNDLENKYSKALKVSKQFWSEVLKGENYEFKNKF